MADIKHGKAYLVGAGPGDPGLITVRGLECLRRAEVVIYDYLANFRLLRDVPSACERIYVGKQAGKHALKQEEINALLVEKCLDGKHVVRLKGGDPFVFGRGGEEALALRDAGCDFEIVPGITAAIAASAYAGIPVTHRGLTSTMAFVTGHEDPTKEDSDIDWSKLATAVGTIIFYMGVRNLPMISRRLLENGRSPATPVALIRWGTYPRQQTLVGTLSNIAEKAAAVNFQPPALIVVGEVVSLRDQLNWFEKRPLFGKRIVVTRSRAQAGELSERFEQLGADVVECPVIRIAEAEDPQPLHKAIAQAADYDWIIFTSVNGVDIFFQELRKHQKDVRALHGAKVCAIGPSTAARLESFGIIADLLPPKYVAESVMESLSSHTDLKGRRILLPRADIARSFLPDAMQKAGASVDEVIAYRTLSDMPEDLTQIQEELANGKMNVVTFTSSSTVRNFVSLIGESAFRAIPSQTVLASIGPETTKTLKLYTDASILEAQEYSLDGIIRMLVDRFTKEA